MRWSVLCFAAVLLAGCVGPNTSLNTLQFSSNALPFPDNYQVEAARTVRDKGGDPRVTTVSYPQQTIGRDLMSPNRWFVCIRGLPDPVDRAENVPRVMDLVEGMMDQRAATGRYEVVLIFSHESRRPSVRDGLDSPLCRDAVFEPITAAPPVV